MPDVRIIQRKDFPSYAISLDWLLSGGTLDQTRALETAVIVALSTDRLADTEDELPSPSDDRRGWWADTDAEEIWGGWPIGSRLWLLRRAKIVDSSARGGATVTRIETYLRECLSPFIERKIISTFEMEVQRNSKDRQRIDVGVVLYRGPSPPIALQFQVLWDEES